MILDAIMRPRAQAATGNYATDWLSFDGNHAPMTKAGTRVNEYTALTLSAVFRAVDNLATFKALLPRPVMRAVRKDSGRLSRERAREHPVDVLLNEEPNLEMTSFVYERTLEVHRALFGTGRAAIERDGRDRPFALWPMDPETTTTERDRQTGQLVHKTIYEDGTRDTLPDADVCRFPWFSIDGICGIGLIKYIAKESIGMGQAIRDYAAAYFGNGATIGTIFSVNGTTSKGQRDLNEKAITKSRGGPGKAWKPMILEGDVKLSHVGQTNESSQTVDLMTLSVQDMCRFFNMPPPFLFELSHATFSNIEELAQWLGKYTLPPVCAIYEQECTRKLFTVQERRDYYVQYSLDGLLRGDPVKRAESFKTYFHMGAINANTICELNDWNDIGPNGDVYFMQTAMAPVDRIIDGTANAKPGPAEPDVDEPEPAPPKPDRKAVAQAHASWLADVIGRMATTIEASKWSKAKERGEQWDAWAAKFYPDYELKLCSAVGSVFDSAGEAAEVSDREAHAAARLTAEKWCAMRSRVSAAVELPIEDEARMFSVCAMREFFNAE